MNETTTDKERKWATTPVSNLVRYKPSGIYFARVRIRGKLKWKSLETDTLSIAKLRLTDFLQKENAMAEREVEGEKGRLTFSDALAIYKERLKSDHDLKPNARLYREKCIESLLKTWPTIKTMDLRAIRVDDCLKWSVKLAEKYSPSVYNNTVGTLRQIIQIGVDKGACYSNPAMKINKRKPTVKKLELPTQEQFQAFVTAIESAGAWCSYDCANLVRFLAYGGFRKEEAANVTWADCDFTKGRIRVRGDEITGTKNSEERHVPMIPEMKELLEAMRAERAGEPSTSRVMRVQEAQKAMDNALKKVPGMKRITHHDLRHFFATRCIEAGVDIPTVSRWLGHRDGGALAMRTYGHLRDEHSTEMAKRVSFSRPTAVNMVSIKEEGSCYAKA